MPSSSGTPPINLPDDGIRLAVLERLQILDTSEEEPYQDAVELAAQLCGTPVGLISFMGRNRIWLKAKFGLAHDGFDTDSFLCSQTVDVGDLTIIENADVNGLGFYAGVPIYAESIAVGTLSVLDREGRSLSNSQAQGLKAIGRQVSAMLEQRLLSHKLESQNRELLDAATEAESLSRELTHSSKRFANLFHGLPVACMTLDRQGRVMEWNEKSTEVYGFEYWEVISQPILDLVVPEEKLELARKAFDKSFEKGATYGANEWNVMRKDGSLIWVLSNSVPIFDHEGNVVGLISSNVDITGRKRAESALQESHQLIELQTKELREANARLRDLASTDGLTGLSNHRTFQDFLKLHFSLAERNQTEVSVILLDIDNFKFLNDEHGHPMGDTVLKRIAKILPSCCRATDLAARYGGEEFIIVLPETTAATAQELAERIRVAIESDTEQELHVTASFGVASYVGSSGDPKDLVKKADQAMYHSKSRGRNRVTLFSEQMEEECAHTAHARELFLK